MFQLDHAGEMFWSLHKCGCKANIKSGETCDSCKFSFEKHTGQLLSHMHGEWQPAVVHGNGVDGKQVYQHLVKSSNINRKP
jgi:hypothetical protein